LFLIDEFGTGTEPGLGGAIAEAILENLTKSGAFGDDKYPLYQPESAR
jgi:DNA mismatch repair protein MutS2